MYGGKYTRDYKAGQFTVLWYTANGEVHGSGVFETEQEAREFGNMIYKRPDTTYVRISRSAFYKKRRKPVKIAEATK